MISLAQLIGVFLKEFSIFLLRSVFDRSWLQAGHFIILWQSHTVWTLFVADVHSVEFLLEASTYPRIGYACTHARMPCTHTCSLNFILFLHNFAHFVLCTDVSWHLGQNWASLDHLVWPWNDPDWSPHLRWLHVQRTHSGPDYAQLLHYRVWVDMQQRLQFALKWI